MTLSPDTDPLLHPPPGTVGVRLPRGIVQPFDLRFAADRFHVMACFDGHPHYEAVEAMIGFGEGQPPKVRAILTRHDQSQIDHVNDVEAFAQAREFDGRQTVHGPVQVTEHGTAARPALMVRFVSFAGEAVELRLQAMAAADPARGGLTDPGGHAPNSSLPLMWRTRSARAGGGTTVSIDGVDYRVAELQRLPHGQVMLNGFFTEDFRMGALRASTRSFKVLERPLRIEAGSAWRYRHGDGGHTTWRVRPLASGELLVAETVASSHAERVVARVHDQDSLEILGVERLGPGGAAGFRLRFLPEARFALDVAGNRDLVTGTFGTSSTADRPLIVLSPTQPAWAIARSVNVHSVQGEAGTARIVTTVGLSTG